MIKDRKINIREVRKRSGRSEKFDLDKVRQSIILAGKSTGEYGERKARNIYSKVEDKISNGLSRKLSLNVMEIRNIVEPTIAEAGYFEAARHYILYGERKENEKVEKVVVVEPEMSKVGREVAKRRYLKTDEKGKPVESVGEMLWRVARHMAKAEINWASNGVVNRTARAFYERIVSWKLVCAGKAMFEAGNPGGTGQLSSCFVLPIEDSIQSIFKTLGDAAVVHKNNGGTGFNFSKIRPHGDKVKNVIKAASGPVDFLKAYSAALAQILQGAKRQGANMAILNVDHPDIYEFIQLKEEDGTIKNFNISVGVTDKFMEAVEADKVWELVSPRNKKVWKSVKAKKLFDGIAKQAWRSGDPGMAFLDRMQEDNPVPSLGIIDATNPCGEIPLLPYESCNLSSISLHKHLKKLRRKKDETEYEIDWDDLEKTVKLGVRFLDDMIEMNTYAISEIEQMVKHGNRRIGLGVMGFSHLLYKLKIAYNSDEAVRLAERLSKFIRKKAEEASLELSKKRGAFANFDVSVYAGTAERYRNCALTMIAPTGTISLLANCSSGIEPVFSLVTLRRAFNEGQKKNRPTKEFLITDSVFKSELKKLIQQHSRRALKCKTKNKILKDFDEILDCVAEHGLKDVLGLPRWFKKVFVTTHDIEPEWHIKVQSAWQKWIDNSVSKTINFSNKAKVGDIKKAYMMAWKMKCKGITIYRDGSKRDQVLSLAKEGQEGGFDLITKPGAGPAQMCPECGAGANYADGCISCSQCGWSKCMV